MMKRMLGWRTLWVGRYFGVSAMSRIGRTRELEAAQAYLRTLMDSDLSLVVMVAMMRDDLSRKRH